jgi:hypothetical protein
VQYCNCAMPTGEKPRGGAFNDLVGARKVSMQHLGRAYCFVFVFYCLSYVLFHFVPIAGRLFAIGGTNCEVGKQSVEGVAYLVS